mmetsp:Transcript_42666/g.74172  ORF Transcript_42666/g.74172 Transcript_42666/m.74172 type:complete len:95 (-) Transcript_42666:55-339(-)
MTWGDVLLQMPTAEWALGPRGAKAAAGKNVSMSLANENADSEYDLSWDCRLRAELCTFVGFCLPVNGLFCSGSTRVGIGCPLTMKANETRAKAS